jgi:hypothetical protein
MGLCIALHHLVVHFRTVTELFNVVRDNAPEISMEQFTARLYRVVELMLINTARYIAPRTAQQARRAIVRAAKPRPVEEATFAQLLLIACPVRSLTTETLPHLSF